MFASLCGCGNHTGWYPMKTGKHWTYQVRAGFDRRVETIKVLRPLTVASVDGYEIASPLGISRLAWVGNQLDGGEHSERPVLPSPADPDSRLGG